MLDYPEGIMYTESFEWVKKKEDLFLIGVTDFAQNQLGDIVYIDLPQVGDIIEKGEVLGELESSKAVSEIYMPLTGEVTGVNEALNDSPEKVNSDPYGSWFVKIKAVNPQNYSSLLNRDDFKKYAEDKL